MTAMVEGMYKEGKIELTEPPAGWPDGPVRVLLIGAGPGKPPPCYLQYGKYPGDTSTLEDFKGAQWHGEAEWDELHD